MIPPEGESQQKKGAAKAAPFFRIAVTGGIACGKSQFARCLEKLGVETLDADDVVHKLIPAEERRRLAKKVFADPQARKELERRIHPLVEKELDSWQAQAPAGPGKIRAVIIPLLFEVQWEGKYDIICAVICGKEIQIERMMRNRGYSREEAEARLAAQMPVDAKAAKSHYVIRNEGSLEELEKSAARFIEWLARKEIERDEG